jgi:hypothetical protein
LIFRVEFHWWRGISNQGERTEVVVGKGIGYWTLGQWVGGNLEGDA